MAHVEFQKEHKVVLGVAPQSVATTTKTSTFYSMARAHHAAVVFIIGAVTAAVTLSVVQGNAAGATGGTTKTIAGKSTAIGTADANSVKIIEVEASELDVANSFLAIAAKAVAAGAGAILGSTIIRYPLRYEPSAYVT